MDKPAQVILQFDNQAYALWKPLTDKVDGKSVHLLSDGAVVAFTVKNFNLSDHQFVQLKVAVDKGHELEVWIPRDFLKMIIQGKSDLSDAFSFVGKTSK